MPNLALKSVHNHIDNTSIPTFMHQEPKYFDTTGWGRTYYIAVRVRIKIKI